MSREDLLNELLANRYTWSLRPPDTKKRGVLYFQSAILKADHIWADLQAHNVVDSTSLEELRTSDPAAFEHAVTNFWTGVWTLLVES